MFECGKAMGNGKGRASLHESIKGFLYLRFCLGIHAGGGFIENENARVSQDRARNGDALSFAAREPNAAFTYGCVVTIGQAEDKIVGIGCFGGCDDFRRVMHRVLP